MHDNDEVWKRHAQRRDVSWVPYHARPSVGELKFIDDGAAVRCVIEVASLGRLVVTGHAVYSTVTSSYRWDSSAEVTVKLE